MLNAGCRVPKDISVTGFDKTRLAEYSNPSITTVDIHRETLGQLAADALHELSSTASPQGKEYRIKSELVIGDSSGLLPVNMPCLIDSSTGWVAIAQVALSGYLGDAWFKRR